MEKARDLYNLKPMVLLRQIPFNLVIADAILMRISAEQVPSVHSVASRYWRLVISSNIWTFKLMSALMSFVQLFTILLSSVRSTHV